MKLSEIIDAYNRGLITPYALRKVRRPCSYKQDRYHGIEDSMARLMVHAKFEEEAEKTSHFLLILLILSFPASIIGCFFFLNAVWALLPVSIGLFFGIHFFTCRVMQHCGEWNVIMWRINTITEAIGVSWKDFLTSSPEIFRLIAIKNLSKMGQRVANLQKEGKLAEATVLKSDFVKRHKNLLELELVEEDWGNYFPKEEKRPWGCMSCGFDNSHQASFCSRCGKRK